MHQRHLSIFNLALAAILRNVNTVQSTSYSQASAVDMQIYTDAMHAYVIRSSRLLQCILTDDADMHTGKLHSHSIDMISAACL